MKHIFLALSIFVLFLLMIFFPSQTLLGASSGLLLWFQILLPTLLPTLIISNILILSNSIPYLVKYVGPIFQKLFRTSSNGSFAALTGFLCGYPVGAKVTAELVKNKQISKHEATYLLSFCNNTSPAFLSSYVILQQFQDKSLLLPTFVILYLSIFLCSILFRNYYHISDSSPCLSFHKEEVFFTFDIIDKSIMNAFETITKIGGYLMLFCILFQWIPCPFFEITTGIQYAMSCTNSFQQSYVLVMGLTSFGGICSIIQTRSVLQGSSLSIFSYTIEKLITALVTSLFAFLYVTIILR